MGVRCADACSGRGTDGGGGDADSLWWALAALDAHAAYGNAVFASTAAGIWDWVHSTSQITQTGVAPNLGGIQRQHVVSANCALQNGVYWTTLPSETYVNSIATGLFLQTSARLYELSHDPKYLVAAEGALEWLEEHTVDSKVEVVAEDGVNGTSCAINQGAFTYNTGQFPRLFSVWRWLTVPTGVFIGGLVSLYRGTGNTSFLAEAEIAGASAMETNLWTNGAGFITEADNNASNNDGVGFRCECTAGKLFRY